MEYSFMTGRLSLLPPSHHWMSIRH